MRNVTTCTICTASSRWILAIGLLAVATAAAAADGRWKGPDGHALPFADDDEIVRFLRDAEVEKVKVITSGINRPVKVRLTKDGVEAHAIFRTVEKSKPTFKGRDDVYFDFRDSYVYECAAYEMSRLLGLDHVPPCVERRLWGRAGSLQLWVEEAMTEGKRKKEGLRDTQPMRWVRQQQTLNLFDALIRNFDRHEGNILIDSAWKVWFIDHTRSFNKSPKVDHIERISWCERGVWQRLRSFDRASIEERLGGYLRPAEISSLLKRRDTLVRHLEGRIASVGEGAVLFSVAVAAGPSATSSAAGADAD